MYLLGDGRVKRIADGPDHLLMSYKGALFAVLTALATVLPAPGAAAQCPPAAAVGNPRPGLTCRFDPVLTRMFTPNAVPPDTYRAYVTESSIETLAAVLRQNSGRRDGASAWAVMPTNPLEVFGDAAGYDRRRVAQLYGGRRARVARGAVVENGRVVTSVWLLSPYPDRSLTRLEPGTLVIEFRVPDIPDS